MAPSKSTNPKDLLTGGVLQMVEAATLGLPFEVWKTHMGTYRKDGTFKSLGIIYRKNGLASFWAGWQPKLVESFLKGGILLFTKEASIRTTKSLGVGDVPSGLIGGFLGGVAQVSVLGPCTFLVTAAVTGDKSISLWQRIVQTYQRSGIGGFYHGGTALTLRQGSNWASRQGLTDITRDLIKSRHVRSGEDKKNIKLSVAEEAISGIIGGALSTWNQPFEVIRIEAQANAAKGLPARSFLDTARVIVKDAGIPGLFQGIIPRMGLCIYQTLFMVTIPHLLKPHGL